MHVYSMVFNKKKVMLPNLFLHTIRLYFVLEDSVKAFHILTSLPGLLKILYSIIAGRSAKAAETK